MRVATLSRAEECQDSGIDGDPANDRIWGAMQTGG
jgi:hypothetical protein